MSHKERTRARIIDEAAKAIREHGATGIGVASLMKRAGLTHGGFYSHFESRDDLLANAVARMFEESRAMFARHLDQPDPSAGLIGLIDDYLSERRLQDVARGCPMPPLLGEAARMPPEARDRFVLGIDAFRARLRDTLLLRGDPAPDELASSLLAEMVGAATLARALEDPDAASVLLRASRSALKRRLGLCD